MRAKDCESSQLDEYVGNSNVNEAIHVPRKKRMSLPTNLVTMIPRDDRYLSSTLFGHVKFYNIRKQLGYIIEESTKDERYFCSSQVRTLPGHENVIVSGTSLFQVRISAGKVTFCRW